MTTLRISAELRLPPDVVTSTSVVFGGKGMGKTNLGSVIVEELTKANLRWSFLDPMGVAWGLRHSKDGKGPGVECVVLGGIHGDEPIDPSAGEIVADLVVDESPRTIIDFSRDANGIPWSKAEKIRFVTAYAHRLFRRQGEVIDRRRREPLLQIVDEAARYIPQTIPHGSIELAACVGEFEQIAEEGRNIGLGIAFLTQRSARINKSVSELADVLFAFRTVGPNSVAAIIDWLGEHMPKERARELAGQIRELDVGQCLVVSPGWLKVSERIVTIRERETFDSSATPKPGQKAQRVTGPAAKPDLEKFKERLAATIERAKANDPKELRKRVAELERENRKLATTPAPSIPAVADHKSIERAVATATRTQATTIKNLRTALEACVQFIVNISTKNFDVAGVDKAELEHAIQSALAKATELIDRKVSAREREMNELRLNAQRIVDRVNRVLEAGGEPVVVDVTVSRNEPFSVAASAAAAVRTPRPPRQSASPGSNGNGGAIGGTPQRILNALRFLETVGTSPASRGAVGGLIGISGDTGTFRTYLSELRKPGYISDGANNAIALTDAGRAIASDDGLPTTRRELHQAWLSKLGGTPSRMLTMLLEAYPDSVARVDLGAACNIDASTGTFRTYLSELRSPGLITDPSKTEVRASDALFPQGLPR